MSEQIIIDDHDLTKTQYDQSIIAYNLGHLNYKVILRTQKLTADFCVKYIYDPDTESGSEDSYLFDKSHILKFQTHITEADWDDTFSRYF